MLELNERPSCLAITPRNTKNERKMKYIYIYFLIYQNHISTKINCDFKYTFYLINIFLYFITLYIIKKRYLMVSKKNNP